MAHNIDRIALDANALQAACSIPGPTWRRIDVISETGSTNADLISRASSGEDIAGTVLTADNQTAGRGRNGRIWSALPCAQISMSMGVPTNDIPASAWGWVPLLTGLAVVDAIADVAGVEAGLKWPNDVLAGPDRHKLAGILAEVAAPASVIVVGVGINVSLEADELPDAALGMATSLRVLGARNQDRVALIAAVLAHMARRVDGLRRSGGADAGLVDEYTARSLTVGSRVRATMPGDREVVGDALAVDEQGRLHIQTGIQTGIDTGSDIAVVSAGDIVHLRPV
jgi:BirA family biotin operon repressor/biotin-[acetyl-CoA-carboxylase] ligase